MIRAVIAGVFLATVTPQTFAQDFLEAPLAASETPNAYAERGFRPLVGAVHVHSTFSNGAYGITELASMASNRDLDFLVVTDSFLTRARYGVGPYGLLSWSHNRPGVRDRGIATFLKALGEAGSATDVTVLGGVEVTPHYYWRGNLREGLRLLGFDRHLLVLGIDEVSVLEELPVIGNETWTNTERDWWMAAPGLFLASFGFVLLLIPRRRRVRTGRVHVTRKRRHHGFAFAFLLAGSGWIYLAYPFGALSDPRRGKSDPAAAQRLIDFVADNGGLTFWSYPEARYPEVEFRGAVMVSAPHPDDLWLTHGYTGFEGIYGDAITVTEAGNTWDRLLLDYVTRRSSGWPSVATGINFHDFRDPGGWYELDRGQTVLWAADHSEDAILEALELGRGYAAFQGGVEADLQLSEFSVTNGARTALAGETLEGSAPPTLTVGVEWRDYVSAGRAENVLVEIVRDGVRVAMEDRAAPARLEWREDLAPGLHYYRVRITAATYELLSNPIFFEISEPLSGR